MRHSQPTDTQCLSHSIVSMLLTASPVAKRLRQPPTVKRKTSRPQPLGQLRNLPKPFSYSKAVKRSDGHFTALLYEKRLVNSCSNVLFWPKLPCFLFLGIHWIWGGHMMSNVDNIPCFGVLFLSTMSQQQEHVITLRQTAPFFPLERVLDFWSV